MKLVQWDELGEPDSRGEDGLVIAISRDELATLSNALGQAMQYVDDWEFDTVVGGTKSASEALQSQATDILQQTRIPE